MGLSGTQNCRIAVIYMKRRSMFDSGDKLRECTSGDFVFDLVAKPTRTTDNWNENDHKKQKYKNLSRSSIEELLDKKYR